MDKYLDQDIAMLCTAARWASDGFLPNAGGVVDQNWKALQAIQYWKIEDKAMKSETEAKALGNN